MNLRALRDLVHPTKKKGNDHQKEGQNEEGHTGLFGSE